MWSFRPRTVLLRTRCGFRYLLCFLEPYLLHSEYDLDLDHGNHGTMVAGIIAGYGPVNVHILNYKVSLKSLRNYRRNGLILSLTKQEYIPVGSRGIFLQRGISFQRVSAPFEQNDWMMPLKTLPYLVVGKMPFPLCYEMHCNYPLYVEWALRIRDHWY